MSMYNKGQLFFLLLLLMVLSGYGQVAQDEIDIERLVESIYAIQDEELDYEALYESLYMLYQSPIDLNRADREMLQATYLLSLKQVNDFLDYRTAHGPILSIHELQAIPGFDISTISQLIPFIYVRESESFSGVGRRIRARKENQLLIRYERTLEKKKGFWAPELKADSSLTSRYKGSPDKIYLRMNVKPSKYLQVGLTAEKDPGEQFIWDRGTHRYGFDFGSFHFSVKNKGKVKAAVMGDYALQIGQGVVLGAGFSPGKGAEAITTIKRGNLGLRPYTSAVESGFFRGLGATISHNNIDLTVFYSNVYRDALESQAQDSTDAQPYITAIRASGLHRTESEIAAMATTKERTIGGNVNYTSPKGQVVLGVTGVLTNYSMPLKRTARRYNQFEFSGTDNQNVAAYFSVGWHNFNFFGEGAISSSGGTGFVGGAMISMTKQWEVSLLYRRYDRNFHALHGASFSENSRNINEEGLYLGLKYTPSSKLVFTAYFDQFRFPWLKYRVDAPSQGQEIYFRGQVQPSKKILIYSLYRRKTKGINTKDETGPINIVAQGVKQQLSLIVDVSPEPMLNLRSRIQFSNYRLVNTFGTGIVIAQDINFSVGSIKVSARTAIFDTDDYDNRQYVYEKDMLYSYSIPAYFGKGIRNYLLIQYKPIRNLTLWARVGRTKYIDQQHIGSGLEMIEGDTKTDVKCQVRYQF